MNNGYNWMDAVSAYMPGKLKLSFAKCVNAELPVEEIRVRVNRPMQIVTSYGQFLTSDVITPEDCDLFFQCLCEHSVYAREDELRSCFITVRGGFRVGICGKSLVRDGQFVRISNPTGFNIRIAREWTGCANNVIKKLITSNGTLPSTVIISSPGAGKTTLLRDIARQCSDGKSHLIPKKVCIADERSEIAGSYCGIPELDVGTRTDVLDGCPKQIGMEIILRTMSPDVLITDEIGGHNDAVAVKNAVCGGVCVIASAHAKDLSQARRKEYLRELLTNGIFEAAVELSRVDGRVEQKVIMLDEERAC